MDYTPYRYFVRPRHGWPAPEAMQEKRRGLNPLVDGRVGGLPQFGQLSVKGTVSPQRGQFI